MSNAPATERPKKAKTMLVEVVDSGEEDITTRIRFLMEDEHDAGSLARMCKELEAVRMPHVVFPTRALFVEWRFLCDKGWSRTARQTGHQPAA